jgi:ketosteroid isomerase-like protein
LLRKMKYLRFERGLTTYRASGRLADAGLENFNRDKLLALESSFADMAVPAEAPIPKIVAALRRVYAIPAPVVPKTLQTSETTSAPQSPDVGPAPEAVTTGYFPAGWKPSRSETPVDPGVQIQQAEQAFFQALRDKNVAALKDALSEEFVMVDIFKGGETDKSMFLSAMIADGLQFHSIECRGSRLRLFTNTAVTVGETRMSGQFGGTPFDVRSRFTHVYINLAGAWKLVSAQGTLIA